MREASFYTHTHTHSQPAPVYFYLFLLLPLGARKGRKEKSSSRSPGTTEFSIITFFFGLLTEVASLREVRIFCANFSVKKLEIIIHVYVERGFFFFFF